MDFKKLYFYLLLIFYPTFNCVSQEIKTEIKSAFDEGVNDFAEDFNGNLYFVGFKSNTYQINYDTAVGIIWKFDNNLNLVDSLILKSSSKATRLYNIDFCKEDTSLIISGLTYDTDLPFYKHSINFYKLNLDLNIIASNYVNFADTLANQLLKQEIKDEKLIFYGVFKENYGIAAYQTFIGTLDKFNLDSINFKILPSDIWYNVSTHFNSSVYFIAGSVKNGGDLPFQYIKLDTNFNHLNTMDIPMAINPFWMKFDTDTSFFLIGRSGNTDYQLGLIHQKNINQIENYELHDWSNNDTIQVPSIRFALDFNNKDSIFIGSIYNFAWGQNFYASQNSWFSIAQTDSLLNIRWERFYGGDGYCIQEVTKTLANGGCIIAGEKYDFENSDELQRDIVIYKLNSQGLLTGKTENKITKYHEAIIYPNPGTTNLNVRLAVQHETADFKLYNLNGQLIIEKKLNSKTTSINTSSLESGTYIYKILNNKGLYESGKWVKN